jgi:hypothetical protein
MLVSLCNVLLALQLDSISCECCIRREGICCENFFKLENIAPIEKKLHFVVARTFEDNLIVVGQGRYIPLLRETVCDLIEKCCQHYAAHC